MISYWRRSAFTRVTSCSCSSINCTVYVSSFSRRPRIVRPSLVTALIGRFNGSRAPVGSISVNCSAAGVRTEPMSVRSGAAADPRPPTRWHVRHAPLPSKTARPRAASPTATDTARALTSSPDRMNATIAVRSPLSSAIGGIPAAGMPVPTSRFRSSSEVASRKRPCARLTVPMLVPFGP